MVRSLRRVLRAAALGVYLLTLACSLLVVPAARAQTPLFNFTDAPRGPVGGLVPYGSTFYGVTATGGPTGAGVVYRVDPNNAASFRAISSNIGTGRTAQGRLVEYNGFLYGTSEYGGAYNYGTIFKVDPSANPPTVTTVASFNGTNGQYPIAGLTVFGSSLYGVTTEGGAYLFGSVFRFDPASNAISSLFSFNQANGRQPNQPLTVYGSVLYGTTFYGGTLACPSSTSGCGTVFKINPATSVLTTVAEFNGANGSAPDSDLLVLGGYLYGTTIGGGDSGYGTIFKIELATGVLTKLASFSGSGRGSHPQRCGLLPSGSYLYGTTFDDSPYGTGTVYEFDPVAERITNVVSVPGYPDADLVASGGYLYGTCSNYSGGPGTIFRYDPILHTVQQTMQFGAMDARTPSGPIVFTGSSFFGTSAYGAAGDGGTAFKIDPSAVSASFASFDQVLSNGYQPVGGLVASGGSFYGAAQQGGSDWCGTVFRVDPSTMAVTPVASMPTALCNPASPLLFLGGSLYGFAAGSSGSGATFKVNVASGEVTALSSSRFNGLAGLGGLLYTASGTTIGKLDPSNGNWSQIATLNAATSGSGAGSLVTDGTYLYGSASSGGPYSGGTVFRVDPGSGSVVVLLALNSGTPTPYGYSPGWLMINGSTLFGMTTAGGSFGAGSLFRIDLGTGTPTALTAFDPSRIGWNQMSPPLPCGSYICGVTESGGAAGGGVLWTTDAAPSITPAMAAARTAGGTPTTAAVATVSDPEDAAGSLVVTASSVPGGITLSGISNNGGTITATIGASCNAVPGPNVITLRVVDSGWVATTAQFTVNVTGNSDPTVGSYPDVSLNAGQTVTVTPTAAPSDNGSVTVTAAGPASFGGTLTTSSSTGAVTVANADAGTYRITVTVTDGCGSSVTRMFTATVNAAGAPQAFHADPDSASRISLGWLPVSGATQYEIWRYPSPGGAYATSSTTTYIDTAVAGGSTYVYRVRAIAGAVSPLSLPDAATTVMFDDDPVTTGMTVRSVHFSQLRTAVNAMRAAAGLGAVSFSDDSLTGVAIQAVHLTQLRTALSDARSALALPPLALTDPTISQNATVVRAAHVQELRSAVK